MIERRRFLLTTLIGMVLTALGSFLYPLLRFLSPSSDEARGATVAVARKDIPPGDAKEIDIRGTPAIIINRPEKGFIVFSRVCTHLGCLVDYEKSKGRLLCPCHGGLYTLDGNVISGPPPRPLDKLRLKIEGENLIIG